MTNMKQKLLSLLLTGLLTTSLLLTGCAQHTTDKTDQTSTQSSTENTSETSSATTNGTTDTTSQEAEQEPYILTFEATNIEGEPLTSECFANTKLTMLNVWATYCNPCINEMPDLGEISSEYDSADFQLIGIISDVMEGDSSDTLEEAKSLIAQTNANYPHLLLNQSLYSNLVGAVSAVPTTFFINQKGELLGYIEGAGSKEDWKKLIDSLLAEMK